MIDVLLVKILEPTNLELTQKVIMISHIKQAFDDAGYRLIQPPAKHLRG